MIFITAIAGLLFYLQAVIPANLNNLKADIPVRDISVWLDEYDNIFSDFDSRSYSDRVLSDDFIGELDKVARENDKIISELRLLIPENIRNKETEEIITRRLHSYFRKNFQKISSQKRQTIFRNLLLLCLGFSLMTLASYIGQKRSENFFYNILFVILEPGGWFIVWTGFDEMFNGLKKRKSELEFYSVLAKSKISFVAIKPPPTKPM